jgi:folate-dependent phosphoribosylglycinamide formyltransferase PurN
MTNQMKIMKATRIIIQHRVTISNHQTTKHLIIKIQIQNTRLYKKIIKEMMNRILTKTETKWLNQTVHN